MPDILDLFLRWWKQILSLVIITLLIAAIIVYTTPKQYLGVATALPAATYASDKGAVFGKNLQVLYPSIGTPDDLDMMLGTAHLDTVYSAVAEQLDLASYYSVTKNAEANREAGSILKGRTRVTKSDYGELKVKAWDGDRNKAADMANAIMQKLQQIHQNVQVASNTIMLEKIKEEYAKKQTEYKQLHDTLIVSLLTPAGSQIMAARIEAVLEQIQEYEKLINEYQLMVNARPQALVIIEKAKPPLWPDKPRTNEVLLASFLLSLIFGLIAALILERRRLSKSDRPNNK